jgi:replication-associated recombination protein RarA
MNPINYKPLRAEEFIGPAKELSMLLEAIAKRSIRSGEPVKLLIRGDPGIGKSALLDPFLEQIGANKWTTTKLNGTQLKIETLDDWARSLCLRELMGTYKVLRIEEIDKANFVVQTRMLTILDDLPRNVAVVCTSNKAVKEFEPRFQSRFQVFSLKAPETDEIKWLLAKFGLRKDDINRIATFACGNVRLALFDAQSALDELAAVKGGRL